MLLYQDKILIILLELQMNLWMLFWTMGTGIFTGELKNAKQKMKNEVLSLAERLKQEIFGNK